MYRKLLPFEANTKRMDSINDPVELSQSDSGPRRPHQSTMHKELNSATPQRNLRRQHNDN